MKKLAEYHDHYKAGAVDRVLNHVSDKRAALARKLGLVISGQEQLGESAKQVVRTLNLLLLQGLARRACSSCQARADQMCDANSL